MSVCNKVGYPSKKEARTDIKRLLSGKDNGNKKLTPYECPACGCWHTTSMTKKAGKKSAKNRAEVIRRLGIIRDLRSRATLSNVLKKQEDWMTLDTDKMLVTCVVFKEIKLIHLFRK